MSDTREELPKQDPNNPDSEEQVKYRFRAMNFQFKAPADMYENFATNQGVGLYAYPKSDDE